VVSTCGTLDSAGQSSRWRRGTAQDESAGRGRASNRRDVLAGVGGVVWFVTGVVGGRRTGFRLLVANIFERVGSQGHGVAPDRDCFKKSRPGGGRCTADLPQCPTTRPQPRWHSNSPSAFPGPPGGYSPITRSSVPQEACYSPADAFDPVCCTPAPSTPSLAHEAPTCGLRRAPNLSRARRNQTRED
jgi:hypothetical protein